MQSASQSLVRATLAMTGTIIGAGVFALPLAFRSTGILLGSMVYWSIALVIFMTHLLYAEAVVRSPFQGQRRFFGQLQSVFGVWAGRLGGLTHAGQILGSCFAYVILGGGFLAALAPSLGIPSNLLSWQVLFWLGGAVSVLFGLSWIARVEAWLTWALVALLLVSTAMFAMYFSNIFFLSTRAPFLNSMTMVGVALFALFGYPVIPEIAQLCRGRRQCTFFAVGAGSVIAACLMWLFGVFAASGLGGASESPAALSRSLPGSFFWLIPSVGFLAVMTSFITLAQDLIVMLRVDLRTSPLIAWGLVTAAPLLLLFFTRVSFLSTVEWVGALFSSLNGLLIVLLAATLMWRKVQISPWWRIGAPVLCAAVFCCVLFLRILV